MTLKKRKIQRNKSMLKDIKNRIGNIYEKKWNIYILIIILLLQISMFISAGISKKGFFVDELWSYGLSNSYYNPHIYSRPVFTEDQYLSPEYFRDYLEVTGEDAFSYDSVMYNQENDAHPPLFYLVLHTISSVFMNRFSKWFGIVPNIFYFVATAIALYFLSCKLLKNKYMALVPEVIWGFSTQTVSYVILIRMYMLFAMFVVLNCLVHSDFLTEGKRWGWRRLLALFGVTLGGCLTQYYYYIFAFFLSAVTSLMMWRKKQWREFMKYAGVMFSGIIAAWVIFPGIVKTLQFGRGREAVGNLISGENYPVRLGAYWGNLQDKMFYGMNRYLIALAVLCVIVNAAVYAYMRVYKKNVKDSSSGLAAAMTVAVLLYMAIVIKIVPFITDRYYFALTPCFWLLVTYIVCRAARGLKYGGAAGLVACLALSLLTAAKGWSDHKVMYQYPSQETVMERLKEYEGASCIYITDGREYTATVNCLEFLNFSEVKLIDLAVKPLTDREINHQTPWLIVYVDDQLDQEEILSQVYEKTGYSRHELLGRGSGIGWEDMEEFYIYVFQ